MLRRVLIANRGEIAVRIARACRELGIASVAVRPDAAADGTSAPAADPTVGPRVRDADPAPDELHLRTADEVVDVPCAAPRDAYLDVDALVAAAVAAGADAVHPGYGFLAESATFARAVADAGLVLVGPSADVIATLGDKARARELAVRSGVPVVPGIAPDRFGSAAPGSGGFAAADVVAFGDAHGWPVVVKATRGGGGRGMRVARSADGVAAALDAARREAAAAFGSDLVHVERYLERPRHIEVQVLADRHGSVVALGDRDCSVQRRHQKLVEEAPAPGLPDDLRTAMADAAVRLVRSVGYEGAGTVEFLVADGDFFFLEVNTRIQVEHPVTELVLGVDLVHEQLRIAGGAPLRIAGAGASADRAGTPPVGAGGRSSVVGVTASPADLAPRGHAVECRINAEDAARGFVPAPGRIDGLDVPAGPGVRWDGGYEAGDEVPVHYDGLVGKLLAWGPTREVAIARLRAALGDLRVVGIATTATVAAAVLDHPDLAAGPVHTSWFEEHADALVAAAGTPDGARPARDPAASDPASAGPADAERIAPDVTVPDPTDAESTIPSPPDVSPSVVVAGRRVRLPARVPGPDRGQAGSVPGASTDRRRRASVRGASSGRRRGPAASASAATPAAPGPARPASPPTGRSAAAAPAAGSGTVVSPMHGTILAVHVAVGDVVPSGARLVTVEAMKMENHVTAPHDGRVVELHVAEGAAVAADQPLVRLAAPGGT